MNEFLQFFASADRFMPHGHCYFWTPSIVWLHVISDAFIVLAYYSIPVGLVYLVRQRQDMKFGWIFLCFATFIVACGTTHLLEIWNVWHSNYWLSGGMKAVTAAASVPTAILLARLIPSALSIPSPTQLQDMNAALEKEIATRRKAEEQVRQLNEELERRVAERTTDLNRANGELIRQIDERRRESEALSESKQLVDAIVEHSPAVIYVKDLAGRYLLVNHRYSELFHVSREDVLGKTDHDLFPKDEADAFHAMDRRVADADHPLTEEETAQLDDGPHTYVSVKSPLRDRAGKTYAIFGVSTDITERKRAEETAAWLASFPERNPNPIVEADLSGAIRYANPVARRMFPDLKSEAFRHPWLEGLEDLARPPFAKESDVLRREIAVGENFYAQTVSYLPEAQRVRVYGSDITARKNAERAVERHRAELQLILDSVPALIFYKDLEGRLVRVNGELARTIGRSKQELEGKTDADLGSPYAEEYRRQDESIMATGEPVRKSIEQLFTAHGDRWIETDKIPHRDECGQIIGIVGFAVDITERKQAELALRKSEAELHAADRRLAEIVQGMTEACFALDREWRFSFVNDRTQALLHHPREEMLGRTIWEVFPQVVGTPFEAHYRRAMEAREPVGFEAFSSIARRWLDVRLFPTGEGLAAFLLDIHPRKLSEEALRDGEARMRLATEATGVGLWEWNVLTNQIRWDAQMFRIYGIAPKPDGLMVYQDWTSSVLPEDLAAQEKVLQDTVQQRGQSSREFRILRGEHAELRHIRAVETVRLNAHGEVEWVVGTSLDVTTRKQAEDKNLQLHEELEQRVTDRTGQLETAVKELEAFSYSVSHDLRAPLRAIDGFSQAVFEDYAELLPAEGQRYLQIIRQGAQRMGALIDDLLAFSRLSRAPLRKRTVQTKQLVCDTLDDLTADLDGRRVDIQVGDLPPCEGDPALLKQVWVNLLSNALKYTRCREAAIIELGATEQDGRSIYFVRDNGAGFDMRYAGKLFGVFQRLHRADEFEGTGVGLAIVQRVIHRHGGRIWAEAAVDRGATFFFTLQETPSV